MIACEVFNYALNRLNFRVKTFPDWITTIKVRFKLVKKSSLVSKLTLFILDFIENNKY